jgi:hypothetical protein
MRDRTQFMMCISIFYEHREFIASNPMHFCVVKVGNSGHQQSPRKNIK